MGLTDDCLQAFEVNPAPEQRWHLLEPAGELDSHFLRHDLRWRRGEGGA
jgi:hypothetical protein